MKISKVEVDYRKRSIRITVQRRSLELPFSKLTNQPRKNDKITKIFIDPELGNEAVTYFLESGTEDSVPIDAFLDFNRDPDYLRKLFLFELTVKAQSALRKSRLAKNTVCRRLKTSPSQLARLLDQTNYRKSVDKMLDLLAVLGVNVKPRFEKDVA